MANYENLVPFTSDQSREEAAKNGRKGGIASGESRRRKADLRKTMNRLLTMEVEVPELSDVLKADGVNSTYEDVITMAMIKQASMGNVLAYKAIMSTVGQTDKSEADLEEQRIRTDRAKRARDQEVGDTDSGNENIQSFLKAMRPSQEDIDALFADKEENNAEEAEEAG